MLEIVDQDFTIAIRGQGGVADGNGIFTNCISRTVGAVVHQGDGNHIAFCILQGELHIVQYSPSFCVHLSQHEHSRTVFEACGSRVFLGIGICYSNSHFRMGSVHIKGLFHKPVAAFGNVGDQYLALGICQEDIRTGCGHLIASILPLRVAERIVGAVDKFEGHIGKVFTSELISFGQGKVQGPVFHAHLDGIAFGVLGGYSEFLCFGRRKTGMLLFLKGVSTNRDKQNLGKSISIGLEGVLAVRSHIVAAVILPGKVEVFAFAVLDLKRYITKGRFIRGIHFIQQHGKRFILYGHRSRCGIGVIAAHNRRNSATTYSVSIRRGDLFQLIAALREIQDGSIAGCGNGEVIIAVCIHGKPTVMSCHGRYLDGIAATVVQAEYCAADRLIGNGRYLVYGERKGLILHGCHSRIGRSAAFGDGSGHIRSRCKAIGSLFFGDGVAACGKGRNQSRAIVGCECGAAVCCRRIYTIFHLAELDEFFAAVQAKLTAVNGIAAQGIGLVETQCHGAVRHGDGGFAAACYGNCFICILGVAVGCGNLADSVLDSRKAIDGSLTFVGSKSVCSIGGLAVYAVLKLCKEHCSTVAIRDTEGTAVQCFACYRVGFGEFQYGRLILDSHHICTCKVHGNICKGVIPVHGSFPEGVTCLG